MIGGHEVYLVAACDDEHGIGRDDGLPWRLKKEMAYFKRLTSEVDDPGKQNIVLMGRTTWESIPEKFRPLAGRKNVVLTRQANYLAEGAVVVDSIDAALALADESVERVYIIGGGRVYVQTVDHPAVDGVYLTEIHGKFKCDVFFPSMLGLYTKKILSSDSEGGRSFDYCLYERKQQSALTK